MPKKTRSSKSGYSSDVSDEEWAFCAPSLALMKEDAAQREYASRAVFNAVRSLARTGCPWRDLPNDLPPWYVVHQQVQRWIKAGCFEALAHDLRKMLRLLSQKALDPTAVILDGRTLQSTPESGQRAGYDGYKRKKGSKVHIAVDTLGHLLALSVTAANAQERAQVGDLIGDVQEITDEKVEVAYADQGYTGEETAAEAASHGVKLVVVKLDEAKRGFVLLPRRWVVERSFAWASRFRRLARDYERLPTSLAGLHWLAFLTLMLKSLQS
jgi:transposase